jgi:hypothetical protein
VQPSEARAGWRFHPAASIAYYDQSLLQLPNEATLSDPDERFEDVNLRAVVYGTQIKPKCVLCCSLRMRHRAVVSLAV